MEEEYREVRFMVKLRIKDSFVEDRDLMEYFRFRLNLTHCAEIKELILCDDTNWVFPKKRGCHEECHAA